MANRLPSYTSENLTSVGRMAPYIAAAAARYGVPPEAVAGALAQEQHDQTASYWNEFKAAASSRYAYDFLNAMYEEGSEIDPSNPKRAASDAIRNRFNADPNAITVGTDWRKKISNPLLVDYGPAGMKFHNAIRAVLENSDDPALARYRNDLYSAGVALQNGSDPALMASTIAAHLRYGAGIYQKNMSSNGDPATGVRAWNSLDPSIRNALMVQFYKQGPTPDRVETYKMAAALNGIPYIPRIGADGAGATYLANESAVRRAMSGDVTSQPADTGSAEPEQASTAKPYATAPNYAPLGGLFAPFASPAQPWPGNPDPSTQMPNAYRPKAPPDGAVFDAGAPALPFIPLNEVESVDPASFDDRFKAAPPVRRLGSYLRY